MKVTFIACICALIALGTDLGSAAARASAAEPIEEIVVTGSRIGRSTTTTPIPVTTLDAEAIALDGENRVADIVNELPSLRTTQTPANSNFSEQEAGTNFLDLRGLGIDRTLVLIDGRRQVGGRPGSAALDTNTIPTALVERVEIITGGASAVYGADAVSGVVNFIMRDDFEGLQLDVQSGIADEGDGETYQASITAGTNFEDDRGNVYLNFTFDDTKDVVGIDRDYANQRIRFATNPANTGPNDGIPDNILFEGTGFISTPPSGRVQFPDGSGGVTLREDLGGPFTFDDTGNLVPQDLGTLVEPFLSIGGNDAGNLSVNGLLRVPVERTLITSGVTYALHDKVKFFAKGKYAQSIAETAQQTSFSLPGLEPIFIQSENPFVPDTLESILDDQGLDGFFVSRTNRDHGKRRSKSDRDTLQLYVGVEGYFNSNIDYTAHYQYGRTDITTEFINRQVPSRFQQALDVIEDPVTGEPVCRDPSGGCVPINVLGPNAATEEALAFALTDYNTTGELEQEVFNATVTGDSRGLFATPGGPLGFAAGVEYREERTETEEGFLRNTGDVFNSPPLDDTKGSFDVWEVFAEVNLPLLAGVPFAESVNLDGAVRYGDYSTVGGTTAWKIGGDWAPSSDVRFRFTLSTAVRAPNIGELFAPSGVDNLFIIDPCDSENLDAGAPTRADNCAAFGLSPDFQSQSLNRTNTVITGGNPDLSEEEADTITAGIVLTPGFLPNFSLAVDYWDIEIEDAINSFPAQAIVNNCFDAAGIDNPFCNLVTRQDNGQFDEIQSTLINVATFEASGIDFEASYFVDLASATDERVPGTADFRIVGTYLDELTFFGQEGGIGDEEAGELGDPEFAFNLRATYRLGAFTFSLEERFQGSQEFDLAEPGEVRDPNDTDAEWYTDIQLRWAFNEEASVFLGIDNLFDNAPPRLARIPEIRSFTGDSISYDQIGRFVRAGASIRF